MKNQDKQYLGQFYIFGNFKVYYPQLLPSRLCISFVLINELTQLSTLQGASRLALCKCTITMVISHVMKVDERRFFMFIFARVAVARKKKKFTCFFFLLLSFVIFMKPWSNFRFMVSLHISRVDRGDVYSRETRIG